MCDCEDKEKFFKPHRYGCRNCYMHTVIQHIVFFLRNSDYQKIDKESVVLSREEYNDLKGLEKKFDDYLIKEIVATRKETAEKIWLQAKTIVDKTKHLVQGREYLHIDALKEIVKSVGVEIKE